MWLCNDAGALVALLDAIARECRVTVVPAPWAPGMAVAFARWCGNRPAVCDLATGTGADAGAAIARALGEMAENLSITSACHPQPVLVRGQRGTMICADARALPGEGLADPGSEGCAAGETEAAARMAALCERVERAALALWWSGQLLPRRMSPPACLGLYRQGAGVRRTMFWSLPLLPPVTVCLVLSTDADAGRIAMGTAAHIHRDRAQDAALREALQAEIAWHVPAHHPDVPGRDAMHHAVAARWPALLAAPEEGAAEPAATPQHQSVAQGMRGIEQALTVQGLDWGFADLTSTEIGVPVARCVVPAWPLARPLLRAVQDGADAGLTPAVPSFDLAAGGGG